MYYSMRAQDFYNPAINTAEDPAIHFLS